MFTLKLLNGWENIADQKQRIFVNGKSSNKRKLSKKQVKEIYKIIAKSKVIKEAENYTLYQLLGG